MSYRLTQCYLPSNRGDIPVFTAAEAGTRLSDQRGMQDADGVGKRERGVGCITSAEWIEDPALRHAAKNSRLNHYTLNLGVLGQNIL